MLRRKVFGIRRTIAPTRTEQRKGPAQSRENTERGRAPREVSQGATFRYALSMPNRYQGAKGPRLGDGPTSAVWQGAGLGVRLDPNDAATLVPWPRRGLSSTQSRVLAHSRN